MLTIQSTSVWFEDCTQIILLKTIPNLDKNNQHNKKKEMESFLN